MVARVTVIATSLVREFLCKWTTNVRGNFIQNIKIKSKNMITLGFVIVNFDTIFSKSCRFIVFQFSSVKISNYYVHPNELMFEFDKPIAIP